jgi:hypothetical protein
MISENSFFRKLPVGMNLEQRLIFEGVGWAIQMLSLSYDKLKAAASQVDVVRYLPNVAGNRNVRLLLVNH